MSSRNHSHRPGHRVHRIERSVAEALECALLPSLNDPALDGLHVVAVEASGNLSSIRVVVAPGSADSKPPQSEAEAALERASGLLRGELAAMLRIKRMPHVQFSYLPLPLWQGEGGGA